MRLVIRDAEGDVIGRHEGGAVVAAQVESLGLAVGRMALSPAGSDYLPVEVADPAALARLRKRFGIVTSDRVDVVPGDPRWPELRARFRRDHTHPDHEIRLFLRGHGLFEVDALHGFRAQLLVEVGEWVALPPQTVHAFDGGRDADFDALRLFSQPAGWVADFVDSPTRLAPPDLDRFLRDWRDARAFSG